jgi:hypothetical protein
VRQNRRGVIQRVHGGSWQWKIHILLDIKAGSVVKQQKYRAKIVCKVQKKKDQSE